MKKIATILILNIAIACILCACHQDNEDYMTQAIIRLEGGDTLTINRVQATADITNLNTRHVVSTTDFVGTGLQIELLRGAYQLHIEGLVDYNDQQGLQHLRPFRAVSDYVELVGQATSEATLNIYFLN